MARSKDALRKKLQGVAREITVNVDSMFRYCMNTAAKLQLSNGGTKITPSTMMQVLKSMTDHLAFNDVLAPPGLVKFAKDAAPPSRKDFDKGEDQQMQKGRSD